MSSTSNSLVMGVAARYPKELVMPFFKSLRASGYQGRVCLFVSQISPGDKTELEKVADTIVDLDGLYGQQIARLHMQRTVKLLSWIRQTPRVRRLYPFLFQLALRRVPRVRRKALQRDLEQSLEGLQVLRYTHYLDYIRHEAPDADYVLISDVRDVIFQRDPFDHVFENDLEVFLESDHIIFETEVFNRRWIHNLYGADEVKKLASQTVSCSGTTMGTRAGMERYLERMIAEIARHNRPMGSHDQGVHNYLLRSGQLDRVTVYHNGSAPVLTMGMDAEKMLAQNSAGEILNLNGEVAPVVHQYDRFPRLAEEIERRFS